MEPEQKIVHFLYVPWTGLGLYNGFRGNRWLKNRIAVFKQFVVPSLLAQTNKDFVLWCSWRFEERNNPYVRELIYYLNQIGDFKTVHTFSGVCFWDDKYSDDEARSRLLDSLHRSMGVLTEYVGQADYVYMTIQPSDDCYASDVVEGIQDTFRDNPEYQAVGFAKGYMVNYQTLEVAEYNPKTNPPFFTVKFAKDVFVDPLRHAEYTGPYKSHEYVGDKLRYYVDDDYRGFLVGTHGENISTVFNHPYKGLPMPPSVLKEFGLEHVPLIRIKLSVRKWMLRKLPHKVQRKLRYWFGELFWQKFYDFLRS